MIHRKRKLPPGASPDQGRRRKVLKNIDIVRFKEVCEAHRETYDPEYWMSFRQSLLVDLKEEFRNWGERPATVRPATFDEIYSNLSVAARRLQQFGASDAQVRFLASLAVKQGLLLSQVELNTLSKAEASAMIDNMKKEG